MLPFIAPLIAGVSSLFGAGLNAASQKSANSTNMKIARYQNAWNLEQWNRENEYNLPTAQMARLKAAGLNPNLVYGSGGASTTSAPSPRAAAANYQAIDYGLDKPVDQAIQTYMAFQNFLLQKSQVDARNNLMSAQADAVRANILNTTEKTVGQKLQNTLRRSTMTYQVGAAQEQLRRLQAGNVLLGQQQVLNNQKYDLNERRMQLQERMLALQFQRAALEADRNRLGWSEYNTRKNQIETQTRIAQKEFNMGLSDWKAMRFGKIGNQYLQWMNPFIQAFSAWSRHQK